MTGRLADHGAASPGPDRFGPSLLSRILSGLAGATILCLTALFTLGTALAAPIGVLVGKWLARRGGRSLTRSGSWWAAIIACTAAITCAFAVSAALAPPGTFRRVQQAAATGPTPPVSQPPTWVTRLVPQAAQPPDPVTERIIQSRPFRLYFSILGAGFAMAILGTIVGSAGWLGAILLSRAFSPRPPG